MRFFLALLSLLCIHSTVFADTFDCKQGYGDGYNSKLKATFGEAVTGDTYDRAKLDTLRLPFLGKYDWVSYRKVSITGFDDKPKNVISAYSIGTFSETTEGTVGLVDQKGKNIGYLTISKAGPEVNLPGVYMNVGVSIYGEPGPVTFAICEQKK